MRVLHVVKTSEGAFWAAAQVAVLCKLGVEVHVALPRLEGNCISEWQESSACLHQADMCVPVGRPWLLPSLLRRIRALVHDLQPDVIHSHFVTNTLAVRWALGSHHPIPRLYQVAGPLHLETPLFRNVEIDSAGEPDWWIASSRYIRECYLKAGLSSERVMLSYYGMRFDNLQKEPSFDLRRRIGGMEGDILIGNVSHMYPPKRLLGQRIGVKAHEDLILALGRVTKLRRNVIGVIVGSAWAGAQGYEERLKSLARSVAGDRIRFTGHISPSAARQAWQDMRLAVHVPISENCGGVIEPLAAGVPVVASRVGGLPEVVVPQRTGWLVEPRNVDGTVTAILHALDHPREATEYGARGRELVRTMFEVERTAREVFDIYQYILGAIRTKPHEFDSRAYVNTVCPSESVEG